MKKQKKPIVLILVLAVLFGGVLFLNRDTSKEGSTPTNDQPDTKQEKKEAVGGDVANQMKNDKISDKGAVAKTTAPQDSMNAMKKKAMAKTGMGGPSILKPKETPQMKPKPNDSSISTQWYSSESGRTKASTGN